MTTISLNNELKKIAAECASNSEVAETAQDKILFFYQVATKKEGGFDAAADRVQSLANQLEAADGLQPPADAPQQLLEEFDKLANKGIPVAIDALEAATLFIQYRYPTMKQEDNLGVEVQINVHKKLEEYLSICEGGKGGEDGKGSFGRFTSARGKSSYLKARAELEKALKPPAADEKKKEDDASATSSSPAAVVGPTNKYLLKQLDVDAARDVARTWSLLKKMAIQTALLFSRNFPALNEPRKASSSGFIG